MLFITSGEQPVGEYIDALALLFDGALLVGDEFQEFLCVLVFDCRFALLPHHEPVGIAPRAVDGLDHLYNQIIAGPSVC